MANSAASSRGYRLISRTATPSIFLLQIESSDGVFNFKNKEMLELVHSPICPPTDCVNDRDISSKVERVAHLFSRCSRRHNPNLPTLQILFVESFFLSFSLFSECRFSSFASVLDCDGGAVFCTHLFAWFIVVLGDGVVALFTDPAWQELKNKSSVLLKEEFNWWSDAACSLMLHDGRSLRQRLMDDMSTRDRNASVARLSSSHCMDL